MKKFNQARVNGGSNYDSFILKRVKQRKRRLLVGRAAKATCDTVKLREVPKAERYQAGVERQSVAGVMT